MNGCIGQCGAESRSEGEMAVYFCMKPANHRGPHHFSYQGLKVPEDEIVPPKDELAALRAFAQTILRNWWEGQWDGADLQELGELHGLLERKLMAETCSEESCMCAEVGAFPLTCFRKTPLLTGELATPDHQKEREAL